MKVLLVGVGGVGEAIVAIAKPRPWMELIVLADYNLKRAEEVQQKLGDPERFPIEVIDASKQEDIEALAKKYEVDLIMNAVDPIFNKQIFDARSEEHTSELQSQSNLVCRLLLEKKKTKKIIN